MQLSTAAPLNRFFTLKLLKMANPFEGKFKAFSANLSAQNAQDHTHTTTGKSAEVFADKPFTHEFRTVYSVALVGQSLSQIVTYCTTAALGVFALTHIIPTDWGIYIAVPLALLFAFGVERLKRSTLTIAAKHLLKYKTFGFVGLVAFAVMLVSIAAALYGAKELPGVVYAKPERVKDASSAEALTAEISRVQDDIERTKTVIASKPNWTAENRTLPRLQRERAALVERRAAADGAALVRSDTEHAEAIAERAEKVEKMQVYSVGAAIVAELIFLFCTGFILYYLFRHYAESTTGSGAPGAGTSATNGTVSARPITANLSVNESRTTKIVNDAANKGKDRTCEHCGKPYIYGHHKQKYCSDHCRVAAWEQRTGAKLNKFNA